MSPVGLGEGAAAQTSLPEQLLCLLHSGGGVYSPGYVPWHMQAEEAVAVHPLHLSPPDAERLQREQEHETTLQSVHRNIAYKFNFKNAQ